MFRKYFYNKCTLIDVIKDNYTVCTFISVFLSIVLYTNIFHILHTHKHLYHMYIIE